MEMKRKILYNIRKMIIGSFHMQTLYLTAPFQTDFTIQTNCNNLVRSLFLKYGKYIIVSNKPKGKVIAAIREDSQYGITFEGNTTTTPNAVSKIAHIICDNTRYDKTIFALHGAAVGYQKKAFLLLASTTGGKTTLASYLTHIGFDYITDDCILLERTSLKIYPYQTPIHLREGGLQVLNRLQAAPQIPERFGDSENVRYAYTPANCVEGPMPLGHIFFIQRTEAKNQLFEMSTNDKMAALMRAPITDYTINADYLKFIATLANQKCSQLFYHDMDFVAEVIRNG